MTSDSDAGQSSPQPNVRYDDFVARVNPDPAAACGGTVLAGFIGKGAAAGAVRIYADHSLTSWVDVPADAVLHAVELPAAISPLGGSTVWVKPGAQLTPGSAPPAAVPGPSPVAQPTTTVFPTHQWLGCPPPQSLGIACTFVGCAQPTATAVPTNVGCPTAATVCTQVGCVHPTTTVVPTNIAPTQQVGCEHTGFVGICGLGGPLQPTAGCRQGTFTPFGGG